MQRDNGGNEEITVDVIGVDDHEKENEWDCKTKEIPEGEYDKINHALPHCETIHLYRPTSHYQCL